MTLDEFNFLHRQRIFFSQDAAGELVSYFCNLNTLVNILRFHACITGRLVDGTNKMNHFFNFGLSPHAVKLCPPSPSDYLKKKTSLQQELKCHFGGNVSFNSVELTNNTCDCTSFISLIGIVLYSIWNEQEAIFCGIVANI